MCPTETDRFQILMGDSSPPSREVGIAFWGGFVNRVAYASVNTIRSSAMNRLILAELTGGNRDAPKGFLSN